MRNHRAERDPRTSTRYTKTRKAWLAGYGSRPQPCCMCGNDVDVTLSGMHPSGPTVEHRKPIREIVAEYGSDWDKVVALTCDTSMWAIAHRRCQDKQGGRTSGRHRERPPKKPNPRVPPPSREW